MQATPARRSESKALSHTVRVHRGMQSQAPPTCRTVPRVEEESCAARGWAVRSRRGPIIGAQALERFAGELGNPPALPEILFGHSSLELRHEASGVVLSFTALDALRQWMLDDLPPLQVRAALSCCLRLMVAAAHL